MIRFWPISEYSILRWELGMLEVLAVMKTMGLDISEHCTVTVRFAISLDLILPNSWSYFWSRNWGLVHNISLVEASDWNLERTQSKSKEGSRSHAFESILRPSHEHLKIALCLYVSLIQSAARSITNSLTRDDIRTRDIRRVYGLWYTSPGIVKSHFRELILEGCLGVCPPSRLDDK